MKFRLPKLMILLLVLYSMIRMWHWRLGFTFFTQLSNLFIASAVLLQLLAGEGKLKAYKFAATVSILVTFFVYLFFLAPFVSGGILEAYRQDHYASLCMHILVPACALTDYLLNDRKGFRSRGWPLYALLPPTVWFAFIMVLYAFGVRWNGLPAPYPFLDFTAPAGWFGFHPDLSAGTTVGIGVIYPVLIIMGLFLLFGFLLRKAGTPRER